MNRVDLSNIVTVMVVGLGCSNMQECIFDECCWSTGAGSCILALLITTYVATCIRRVNRIVYNRAYRFP